MKFDEWINLTLDDEKDTLCLIDAWRAGTSAMLKLLISAGWLDEEWEAPIRADMRDFMEGK